MSKVRATVTVQVLDGEGRERFMCAATDEQETGTGWSVVSTADLALNGARITCEGAVESAFPGGAE